MSKTYGGEGVESTPLNKVGLMIQAEVNSELDTEEDIPYLPYEELGLYGKDDSIKVFHSFHCQTLHPLLCM